MNTENKIYAAADFAKYHNGNMSFAEMHALEKAALNDPILADALEGYANTETGEKDVVIIGKRLSFYNNKIKTFRLFAGLQRGWMRIAAILLLTFGISYFFYNKMEDKQIKLAQNKISIVDTLQIAEANTDNIASKAEKPVTTTVNKEENPLTKNETNAFERNKKELLLDSAPLVKDKAEERNDDKKNFTINKNEANNFSKKYTQQGNVTDMLGDALHGVTVKDKNSNIGTITDYDGKFKLKTTDSNAYVSVGSVGYESKEVKLQNNKLQSITLQKKNTNLEEVVVTGYGIAKKMSERSAATTSISSKELSSKVAGIHVQTQREDTTLNSTQVFNEYVKNNKIPLFDENNKPHKGKVVLFFEVDKYGKPQNITIASSSCNACNDQAINLLKSGPAWSSNVLQMQRVIIEF